MVEIRKLLDEQQRLRREMYRNHNGKAAFEDFKQELCTKGDSTVQVQLLESNIR